MRRAVKIVGWVVGAAVVLVLGATLAIKMYCTKDRVLGWVVPPLEARLHRTVTVAAVGAGLAGIRLEGIDVRATGATTPLLATPKVQVRWNPWSLLSGTLEITEVRVIEPRIRVVRLPDGTLDVDDLRGSGKEEAAGAAPTGLAGRSGGPPVAAVVKVIALQAGQLEVLDRSSEPSESYVLEDVDASVTEITAEGPIPFELSARLPLDPAARLTGRGTLDASAGTVAATVQVADVQVSALNRVLGGGRRLAAGVLGMDLAVKRVESGRIAAKGKLKVDGFALASRETRGAPTDLTLEFDATANLTAESASVNSLALGVGGQLLTGIAGVENWGARPRLSFQLHSDELRLDELLALIPAADSAGAPPVPASRPPISGGGPGLDAEGEVTVSRLRHGNLKLEEVAVRLLLEDDQLQMDPITAGLYGGTVAGNFAADLTLQGPEFEAAAHGEALNLGRLLAALTPTLDGSLTGTAVVDCTARGRGGDVAALESRTNLIVKDGKLVTHPLVQEFTELFQAKEYRTLNFYDLLAEVGTEAGVATVDSLIFRGPRLQATGKGTVTLRNPVMDLRFAVALPREVARRLEGRKEILDTLTDAQGWTRLPLRLEGSPAAPRYSLDSRALEKVAAKELEKRAEEVLEKAPVGGGEKDSMGRRIQPLFER